MAKEFDLHGHTREMSWFEFVNYDVRTAIQKAQEVGLDGIAITQHWSLKGIDKALECAEQENVIVVPGVELSSRIGSQAPHIIALGITPENVYGNKKKLPFLWSPKDTIQWIHDQGGVAIAPHPVINKKHIALTHQQVMSLGKQLDGIETVTPYGVNPIMSEFAKENNIAPIGSSDFHLLAQIGLVGTRVPDTVTNWMDVVNSIRNNQTEAFIRTDILEELQRPRGFRILLQQIMGSRV